ncbi:MAG: BTAD domain-containing putative transcriptional regulator [Thiohalomonadaceae bacterium]
MWVRAPAGAGKTTLVASYARARQLDCLWYQLDTRDSDAAAFFHGLREAVARRRPSARRRLPLLAPEYHAGARTYARTYFERLGEIMPVPFLLVLDDFQELPADAPLQGLLRDGIHALPTGARVVLLSRDEPPPAFSSARAEHRYHTLDDQALAFSLSEAKALARGYRLPGLSDAALAALHRHTHGWAAGLVLSLEEAARSGQLPMADRPLSPAMFHYLAAEVLGRMPREEQSVLIRVAPLQQVRACDAAALTGEPDANRVLEALARRRYFTYRLEGREAEYRFHPLFREFLQQRLVDEYPAETLAALHRRCAQLLIAAGRHEEAAALMQESGDECALADLVESHAGALMAAGQLSRLDEWLGRLPQDVLSARPWLCYWKGASLQARAPGESRRYFEQAYTLFETRDDLTGMLESWIGVIDALVVDMCDLGSAVPWIRRFETLHPRHPQFPNAELEARVVAALLTALTWHFPQRPETSAWAERARHLAMETHDQTLQSRLLHPLAVYYEWTGQPARAGELIAPLRALARTPQVTPLVALNVTFTLGIIHWIRGDKAAEALFEEGLALAARTGVHVMDAHLAAGAVYAALSEGDLARAEVKLTLMQQMLALGNRKFDRAHFHLLCAWRELLAGRAEQAVKEGRQALEGLIEVGAAFPEGMCRFVYAQALHLAGERTHAWRELTELERVAVSLGSPSLLFLHHTAAAWFSLNEERADAVERLRTLMDYGRAVWDVTEFGWQPLFGWQPQALAALCAQALRHDIHPGYACALIASRRLTPPAGPTLAGHWPWRVRVHALGRWELKIEGRSAAMGGRGQRKPMELLRALLAFGGRSISVEKLADTLWPDADGDAAYRSLITNLHRLRKLLGDADVLILRNGMLSLDERQCWTDVWSLEQILARLDEPCETDELAHLIPRLLELYRGDFLEEDADAPWAQACRERLRSRVLIAMESLAARAAREGRCDLGARLYQKAVETDSLRESSYHNLMACHIARERASDARSVFERCRRALATAGRSPSAATETLARLIDRNDPAAAAALCARCRGRA